MGAGVGVGVGVGRGLPRARGIGWAEFMGASTLGVCGGALWGVLAAPVLLTVRPTPSPDLRPSDRC